MSLIARCPTCQTWYKVVPDQLRISGGWVRCGQCAEVFDASLQLVEAESELPPEPAQADVQPEVPWNSAALLIKPSLEAEVEIRSGPSLEPARAVLAPRKAAPEPLAEPVSFMRATEGDSDRHRRGISLLWGVLSVFLMLGLLLQSLYRERDQLAAVKPEFMPALQTLCEFIGCSISPLQRIEALALDSATFHQVDQESFEVHVVVKNKTQRVLALPAIELTLTDLTDQPVLRRVFTPAELGATTQTLAASGEWSATAQLRVNAEDSQPRALGYRLLVFYP
ncbi:MAG: hypothetical protein CO105_09325 [Comamonadaceae bacterium CG_4_9_14_3_um_filter_60_33]|nr:MAG: hypothetical protein COZ09_05185 [Comamonadaceae bacterium CG_4_10_14_3_um_filter_60_42]PJB43212.1 MAG: hypothetical protein CO105_09325 [Comamonadaceae bacterium CG_4_9_14_3_um_filter_60_33]